MDAASKADNAPSASVPRKTAEGKKSIIYALVGGSGLLCLYLVLALTVGQWFGWPEDAPRGASAAPSGVYLVPGLGLVFFLLIVIGIAKGIVGLLRDESKAKAITGLLIGVSCLALLVVALSSFWSIASFLLRISSK
ncbi:MAG: hypothetical protein JXR96_30590 [Deltaproteobacteria bacterium]|nr:hypothetical protein [Deltaproteobacteria bacterium]